MLTFENDTVRFTGIRFFSGSERFLVLSVTNNVMLLLLLLLLL